MDLEAQNQCLAEQTRIEKIENTDLGLKPGTFRAGSFI